MFIIELKNEVRFFFLAVHSNKRYKVIMKLLIKREKIVLGYVLFHVSLLCFMT